MANHHIIHTPQLEFFFVVLSVVTFFFFFNASFYLFLGVLLRLGLRG